MPIENKDDKQILDLLENKYPLKAIKVDFKDLNNRSLIIKSSFQNAYKVLDDTEKKDNWFYIIELNQILNNISVIGLVNFSLSSDGWLNLYWIETNKMFKKKGYSKEIIIYLKKYVKWMHWKGITAYPIKPSDFPLFQKNLFKNGGSNSSIMRWNNE